jgi:hypothetical protein
MPDVSESVDKGELEKELARLRAENDGLRAMLRVEPTPDPGASNEKAPRPVRVLLLPDPTEQEKPGVPGPQAISDVARVLVNHLQEQQPSNQWRAEFDLARIPPEAACYQLGEALARLWDGSGPLPATFVVAETDGGKRRLRRCLVAGESASEIFREGYDRLLTDANDLLEESQAAHEAGSQHHAGWALKAVDVILARLKLAHVIFEEGGDGWREILAEGRPEYEPQGELG